MKLTIAERSAEKKRDSRRLRREGNIPAVIYQNQSAGEMVSIPASEFQTVLRQVQKGHLSTTIFELTDAHGKSRKAIIKEIQYHPTSYDVMHLDFAQLQDSSPVKIKVPIELIGAAQCKGVKEGGVVRVVIRYAEVSCLPENIPSFFELDISSLGMRDKKRLSDIQFPEGVKPRKALNEVVVVIVKR